MQTIGLSAQDTTYALSPYELQRSGLQYRLDSITKRVEKEKYMASYCVYDITTDSMLYTYNPNVMMKPASTQKMFTTITALSLLGAEYMFSTFVNIDGNIKTDSLGRRYLKGDVCIRGSYDPTLQDSAIVCMSNKILSLAIDSIDGQICVDNRVMYIDKKVKNAPKYVGKALYDMLRYAGVCFSCTNAYIESAEPIARGWNLTSVNTPIAKVLNRTLKNSDNTYADCILYNLSSMGYKSEWTVDKCRSRVRNLVYEIGGNQNDYIIVDGSGLSHDNRTTAALLTKLLVYGYKDDEIREVLLEHLPIGGVDGTLEKRMKSAPLYRNVRAKTGTLNGVSTLAGYETASNGHTLCFVTMVNNLRSASVGKALQESICYEIAK